jgi:hypothetical protein
MNPEELKKEELQKIDEEVLHELESTEVSGGKLAEADDTNYFQCGCQNGSCSSQPEEN